MLSLDSLRRSLASLEPRLLPVAGKRQAAVAVVLREREGGPEILFIERAVRRGDPWSGQMAFPGGRVERVDPNPRFAAERETFEEVGVSLAQAEPLGRLDDLEGRHAGRPVGLVVSGFVYRAEHEGPIVPSPEVREALWVPVPWLVDPARQTDREVRRAGASLRFPAIVVGDPKRHVVWGLTYRFLEMLLGAAGAGLPGRWPEEPVSGPARSTDSRHQT